MDRDAFAGFAEALDVGVKAPSAALIDASTGDAVELSSLWRHRPVVLEFGSIS